MAIDEFDETFKEEREIGYSQLYNASKGSGLLLEVILYKGVNIISTDFNEFTVLPDNAMTGEKGNRIVGYFSDPNVKNNRPPRFFRLVQGWDCENNMPLYENNIFDVDYASVYGTINLRNYNVVP